MVRIYKPGMALPFGAALKPDLVVGEAGSYEKDDGMKVVLSGNNLVFLGAFDGTSVSMGIDVHTLLAAIETHTRNNES